MNSHPSSSSRNLLEVIRFRLIPPLLNYINSLAENRRMLTTKKDPSEYHFLPGHADLLSDL
ncbi:hypothetical protein PHOSAC3_120407 [Mesotoga infera]|nr:hypothetical protein PHOSAC3_120407 [Mesotoga infera]